MQSRSSRANDQRTRNGMKPICAQTLPWTVFIFHTEEPNFNSEQLQAVRRLIITEMETVHQRYKAALMGLIAGISPVFRAVTGFISPLFRVHQRHTLGAFRTHFRSLYRISHAKHTSLFSFSVQIKIGLFIYLFSHPCTSVYSETGHARCSSFNPAHYSISFPL